MADPTGWTPRGFTIPSSASGPNPFLRQPAQALFARLGDQVGKGAVPQEFLLPGATVPGAVASTRRAAVASPQWQRQSTGGRGAAPIASTRGGVGVAPGPLKSSAGVSSALSTAGKLAGALGTYGQAAGLSAGTAGTFSALGAGLGAGAVAFGLASLGNHALGNDKPWLLDEAAQLSADNTYSDEGKYARVTTPDNPFSALFNTNHGLMVNTNGTTYTGQDGKTYNVPLTNGRTGHSPRMIYQNLQKQGAPVPPLEEFLQQYNQFASLARQ
jgi:hypothetical protein